MPTVTLDLKGDDGSSRVVERLPTEAAASDRAHELSCRMAALGVDHTVACLTADRRAIPYRDHTGALVGDPGPGPESLEAYMADVEAMYEDYHRRMADAQRP